MVNEREWEKVLKALSNKRRMRIVAFIKRRKRANVGDVAKHIKLSFRSTSKHLSVLEKAGILDKNQVGLYIFYSLTASPSVVFRVLFDLI
jgi:DNA-binding transcriptional ArsR family regulator